jgi:hypothetical protein
MIGRILAPPVLNIVPLIRVGLRQPPARRLAEVDEQP